MSVNFLSEVPNMGLLDFFTDRRDKKTVPNTKITVAKTPKFLSNNSNSSFGNSYKYNSYFAELYAAYNNNGTFFRAVSKIKELIFRHGFHIYSSDETILDYINARIRQIETTSNKPFSAIIRNLTTDYVLYGNCFLYKYRDEKNTFGKSYVDFDGKNTKPISAVFHVPARFVSYNEDTNKYIVDKEFYNMFSNMSVYDNSVQDVNSDNRAINAKDMMHLKSEEIGEFFPGGFQSRALSTLVILASLEDIAENMIENRQFFVTVYTVGTKDKPGDIEDIETVKTELENASEDGILVIPGNHDINIKNMSSLKDIKEYIDYFKTKLLNELGISSVGLGEGGQANRATAEEANSITYDLVKNIQDSFSEQFNFYFLRELLKEKKDFKKEEIFYLEDNELPKLVFPEPDTELMIKLNTHEVFKFEHSIQTEDESRQNMNMEPIKDRSKLFQNMYGKGANSQETNNLNQPQNQHSNQ